MSVRKRQKSWAAAEAKAHFSELVERALTDGPQTVTRNGRKAVVVVAAEEWERTTKRRGTLAEFFASAPEGFADLDLRRIKDKPRDIDL
jgi:prevent-host-death family protein